MNTSMPSAAHLEKLQNLTQNYAQFSRSRAGLAYLVLAVLLPLNFLLAHNLPLNTPSALLGGLICVASISLWLVLRWKIVEMLYQKFGVARAAMPLLNKEYLFGMITGTILGAIFFWVLSITTEFHFPETFLLTVPALLIAIVSGLREIRNGGLLTGLAVVFCGGFVGGGINSNAENLTQFQRVLPFILLVAIPGGFIISAIREHLQFKNLESELESLKSNQS
jgi:hypothetical protein